MTRYFIIVGAAVPVSMLLGAYIPEWLAIIGGVMFGGSVMIKLVQR